MTRKRLAVLPSCRQGRLLKPMAEERRWATSMNRRPIIPSTTQTGKRMTSRVTGSHNKGCSRDVITRWISASQFFRTAPMKVTEIAPPAMERVPSITKAAKAEARARKPAIRIENRSMAIRR